MNNHLAPAHTNSPSRAMEELSDRSAQPQNYQTNFSHAPIAENTPKPSRQETENRPKSGQKCTKFEYGQIRK